MHVRRERVEDRELLLEVWERSVRATHHFLQVPSDDPVCDSRGTYCRPGRGNDRSAIHRDCGHSAGVREALVYWWHLVQDGPDARRPAPEYCKAHRLLPGAAMDRSLSERIGQAAAC